MTLAPAPSPELQGATTSVTQILYCSVSRDGAASGLQMSDILNEARLGNARDGVTGVLTAVEGRFVQIIEGPDAALDGLMAKLLRDPRHTGLSIIERRLTTRRSFGDWDMVSPRLAPRELSLLALLLEDTGAGLEAYAEILSRAIAEQDAMLEGRRSPGDVIGRVRATPEMARGSEA